MISITSPFEYLTTYGQAPKSPAAMITEWEHLNYFNEPAHAAFNELKAWLRSSTQDPETLFLDNTFSEITLRAAVQAAVFEIRDNLDEQIELLVTEAETYNIQIAHGDYYATRDVDWDGMPESDLDEMGREELMELMEDAKGEIAWLVNEISRLEAYICVERQMEQYGEKGRRTVLRPMGRKKRDEEADESNGSPMHIDLGVE